MGGHHHCCLLPWRFSVELGALWAHLPDWAPRQDKWGFIYHYLVWRSYWGLGLREASGLGWPPFKRQKQDICRSPAPSMAPLLLLFPTSPASWPGWKPELGHGKSRPESLGCYGEPRILHLSWAKNRGTQEQPLARIPIQPGLELFISRLSHPIGKGWSPYSGHLPGIAVHMLRGSNTGA